jgi:hypothetical protein
MKMFISFDWVRTAELVSASSGKFLVGANYASFSHSNYPGEGSWSEFVERVRKGYGETKDFFDLTTAIINDDLVIFDTEAEARRFFSMFNGEDDVFAYLVSPTEGYLTDTN